MNKLYPIGTQFITRRLSQAALYYEIFGEYDLSSYTDESKSVAASFIMEWMPCFYYHAEFWCVWVTAENQKWLSPVPMVGDILWRTDIIPAGCTDNEDGPPREKKFPVTFSRWGASAGDKVILRTYLNGQRAPLIEWDEVLLPEGAIA